MSNNNLVNSQVYWLSVLECAKNAAMIQRTKNELIGQENISINNPTYEKKSNFFQATLFSPTGKYYRFLALFFTCSLGFASSFCYDNPSALEDNLIQNLNITSMQFSLTYSVYAWPAVITSIIGGALIDSVFGICKGTIIYMTITLIGQLVYATGALTNMYGIMLFGRFIFGVGAEPLTIGRNNYAVSWFHGKELNLAFGLHSSCDSIASVLNFWVMDPLFTWLGNFYSGHILLGVVLFIGNITCVFSMMSAVILGVLHKHSSGAQEKKSKTVHSVITFKDVKRFHWRFWLLNFINASECAILYSFIALSKVYFMGKFKMTSKEANRINSIMYFVCIPCSPLLGLLIDKTGRNVFWLIMGAICAILAHAILAFSNCNPCFSVILLGITSSTLSSALWPLIPITIPHHQLGTAYGLCWSASGLFLAITTVVGGYIVDNLGYFWLEMFFLADAIVCLLAVLGLLIANTTLNSILNMTLSENEPQQTDQLCVSELPYEEILGSDFEDPYLVETNQLDR